MKMNQDWLHHSVKYVKLSNEKTLLLLDNCYSFLSINVLDYSKENVSQISKITVYQLLKKYLTQASNGEMVSESPRKDITIYDIPELVTTSLPLVTNVDNILFDFRVTGIFPLNRNIFPVSEFSRTLWNESKVCIKNSWRKIRDWSRRYEQTQDLV